MSLSDEERHAIVLSTAIVLVTETVLKMAW